MKQQTYLQGLALLRDILNSTITTFPELKECIAQWQERDSKAKIPTERKDSKEFLRKLAIFSLFENHHCYPAKSCPWFFYYLTQHTKALKANNRVVQKREERRENCFHLITLSLLRFTEEEKLDDKKTYQAKQKELLRSLATALDLGPLASNQISLTPDKNGAWQRIQNLVKKRWQQGPKYPHPPLMSFVKIYQQEDIFLALYRIGLKLSMDPGSGQIHIHSSFVDQPQMSKYARGIVTIPFHQPRNLGNYIKKVQNTLLPHREIDLLLYLTEDAPYTGLKALLDEMKESGFGFVTPETQSLPITGQKNSFETLVETQLEKQQAYYLHEGWRQKATPMEKAPLLDALENWQQGWAQIKKVLPREQKNLRGLHLVSFRESAFIKFYQDFQDESI